MGEACPNMPFSVLLHVFMCVFYVVIRWFCRAENEGAVQNIPQMATTINWLGVCVPLHFLFYLFSVKSTFLIKVKIFKKRFKEINKQEFQWGVLMLGMTSLPYCSLSSFLQFLFCKRLDSLSPEFHIREHLKYDKYVLCITFAKIIPIFFLCWSDRHLASGGERWDKK